MPYCFLLYFTFRPQLPALHVIGSIWGAQWYLGFLLEVMPLAKHCRAHMLLHKQKQLTQVTDKINKLCLRHIHSRKTSMRHPQIMTACRNLFMKSSMDRPTLLRVPNYCQHRFCSQSRWVIIWNNVFNSVKTFFAGDSLTIPGTTIKFESAEIRKPELLWCWTKNYDVINTGH